MAGLEAEDAGVSELAGPAEDVHAAGVVGGEEVVAVVAGAGHGVGLVDHLPGLDAVGDGVGGVGDVDGELLFVVVAEAAIGDADEFGPEGPLFVGEDGVVEEEDALAALAQLFEDGAGALFGEAAGHVVEEEDVVGVENVADVGGPVGFKLDVAVDLGHVAEDGVEARNVEEVAAGDDGGFDAVIVGLVCAHRLIFPFSPGEYCSEEVVGSIAEGVVDAFGLFGGDNVLQEGCKVNLAAAVEAGEVFEIVDVEVAVLFEGQ